MWILNHFAFFIIPEYTLGHFLPFFKHSLADFNDTWQNE